MKTTLQCIISKEFINEIISFNQISIQNHSVLVNIGLDNGLTPNRRQATI